MIGGRKSIDYGVPFLYGIKGPIIKMGAWITKNSSRHAKSSKDVLPKELHYHLSIISPKRDDLNPLTKGSP